MADFTSSLHSQQLELTRYLRDPDSYPPPAQMNPARAQVYLDLVLNNLLGLLGGTFPVLVAVLGDAGWRALVRRFCVTTARKRHVSEKSHVSLLTS